MAVDAFSGADLESDIGQFSAGGDEKIVEKESYADAANFIVPFPSPKLSQLGKSGRFAA